MQESSWCWQYSDRYAITLFPHPHLHTPFPLLSPSLISLMVSVAVKHDVYFLRSNRLVNNDKWKLSINLSCLGYWCWSIWLCWRLLAQLEDDVYVKQVWCNEYCDVKLGWSRTDRMKDREGRSPVKASILFKHLCAGILFQNSNSQVCFRFFFFFFKLM